ncbi:cationic peroxidase [Medicago truncatula]|uniref:Peroxidase n=1 Tax=Medicago truncatula TaxID=3880 RepID=G7INV1_MEDTR|nr:cationic peroxidase [Medicago truncatula]
MECTLLKVVFILLVLGILNTLVHGQGTRVGFYSSTCSQAESIVKSTVTSHVNSDSSLAPGTEKTAFPNLGLRGFEVIEDAKTKLEAACPGVVSCADILSLAARDSVVLSGGLSWQVLTGRRDGRVSQASDVNNLPAPSDSVDVQKQKFAAKGLNTQDLVTLVGGHTIGTTACQFFSNRLRNFTTNGAADPSIDPSFLSQLQTLCPQNSGATNRIALDTGSQNKFDNSYYANLRNGRGILQSDQALWNDASTKTFVQRYLGLRGLLGLTFNVEFGNSMVKMSNIGVKTGVDGEIRKICSAFN